MKRQTTRLAWSHAASAWACACACVCVFVLVLVFGAGGVVGESVGRTRRGSVQEPERRVLMSWCNVRMGLMAECQSV